MEPIGWGLLPIIATKAEAAEELRFARSLDWVRRHERMRIISFYRPDIFLRLVADMGPDELLIGANFGEEPRLPSDPPIALPNEAWMPAGVAGERGSDGAGDASGSLR